MNMKVFLSETMILAVMNAIEAIAYKSLKNSGLQRASTGFNGSPELFRPL